MVWSCLTGEQEPGVSMLKADKVNESHIKVARWTLFCSQLGVPHRTHHELVQNKDDNSGGAIGNVPLRSPLKKNLLGIEDGFMVTKGKRGG